MAMQRLTRWGQDLPRHKSAGRRLMSASLLLICLSVVDAIAVPPGSSDSYVDVEVLQADPIIEIVREPVHHTVCHEVAPSTKSRSKTPLVVGGILGGVIGSRFGSGSGRTAAGVAGAALGASLGADHARNRNSDQQVCDVNKTYREYERVVGYRVKYRYAGDIHTTETKKHPGDYLRIRLSAAPS